MNDQEDLERRRSDIEGLTEVEERFMLRKDKLPALKEELANEFIWDLRGPRGAERDRWHKLRIRFVLLPSQGSEEDPRERNNSWGRMEYDSEHACARPVCDGPIATSTIIAWSRFVWMGYRRSTSM